MIVHTETEVIELTDWADLLNANAQWYHDTLGLLTPGNEFIRFSIADFSICATVYILSLGDVNFWKVSFGGSLYFLNKLVPEDMKFTDGKPAMQYADAILDRYLKLQVFA